MRVLFQRLIEVESPRKPDSGARVIGGVARVLRTYGKHRLHEDLAGDRVAYHIWNVGADVTVPIDPAFRRFRPVPGQGELSGRKRHGGIGSDQARSLLSMVVTVNAGGSSTVIVTAE